MKGTLICWDGFRTPVSNRASSKRMPASGAKGATDFSPRNPRKACLCPAKDVLQQNLRDAEKKKELMSCKQQMTQ